VGSTGGGATVSTGGGLRPEVSREVYTCFLQAVIARPIMKMEHTIIVLMNFIFLLVRLII
jgi:hypothetical protein